MTNLPLAKKSLGQHWLNDDSSLNRICELANISEADTVLEIGPGTGLLTSKLIAKAKQVIAVELDSSLTAKLQKKFKDSNNLKLVDEDILKFDFSSLSEDYKLVANIPYYLTSNLIRKISETTNQPKEAILLVQKEIAERLAARPGSMSLLSVTAQYYWEVEPLDVIKAYLFEPSPKVDSQIIRLSRKDKRLFIESDEKAFFNVVRAGFSQRRKKLLNSLSVGLKVSKVELISSAAKSQINLERRAQTLTINEWADLYESLLDLLSKPS